MVHENSLLFIMSCCILIIRSLIINVFVCYLCIEYNLCLFIITVFFVDYQLQSTNTCTSGNAASKIETKSNPFDILKRHTSEILDAISDPIKLANDLSSIDLLTHQVKDDVLTTPESRYLKASKIVNEIQRCIKVYNDEQKLTSFCIILKKQKGNWALSRISDEMMKELNC